MDKPLRIGIVTGEASGDILGADLIREIKKIHPDVIFEGIGGPLMKEAGFNTHVSMEKLAVMGLVEVIGRMAELLAIRRGMLNYFLENPPDVFVGIDSPDFTLPLERALHDNGIKTVHYVSPSVWAWRSGRVKKIALSTDLVLTLFPFETEPYENHNIPVQFVGHPLADAIPFESDQQKARQHLGLHRDSPIVALLPGSRENEIKRLLPVFIETAELCFKENNDLRFVIPCINGQRMQQVRRMIEEMDVTVPLHLELGRSKDVMAASDVVLMASGTTTLEALLLKRPMVVAYKMAYMSHWIISRLLQIPYVALPNLLAGKKLVPEFIQDAATPEALADAVLGQIAQPEQQVELIKTFEQIHQQLCCNASEQAAGAILRLVDA